MRARYAEGLGIPALFAVERENLSAADAAAYWRDRLNPSILRIRKIREKEGK